MKSFLILFLLLIGLQLVGQNQHKNNDFWNNVQYGGGIGLGFTNGGFNGSLSPMAIYHVNDQFATGVSLNLNYAKFNNDKLFAYGGSILSLYHPVRFIQLSAELEQLRINRTYNLIGTDLEDNYWSPAFFIGLGYRNQNVTFGVRYDLLHDANKSIYANRLMPFVRVYF